jgi:hypothetical protein
VLWSARVWTVCCCLLLGAALLLVSPHAAAQQAPASAAYPLPRTVVQPGWNATYAQVINRMRAATGAGPVHIVTTLNARSRAAAVCIGKTGQDTDLHNPSRTAACNHATSWMLASRGASESLMATSPTSGSPRTEMMKFGSAPFHSLALADPRQTQMGFGTYFGSSPNPDTRFAVSVDVTGGAYGAGVQTAPIMAWPAAGWSVAGTTHKGDEWPDPLDLCGWKTAGPAMWFARPSSSSATVAQGLTLKDSSGHTVKTRWCRITAGTASFTDPNARGTAKGWLTWMNAEIVFPSVSLKGQYTFTARVNGHPVKLPFRAV